MRRDKKSTARAFTHPPQTALTQLVNQGIPHSAIACP
jgi:hypothetical protein